MRIFYRYAALLCITALLAACGTTQPNRQGAGYKKPPANLTVGQGPNRALAVYALKLIGTPYYFGGSSPEQGFDCSGLIQYSTKKSLNLNAPRTAAEQSAWGRNISLADIKAGDLIFFETSGQRISHSGIYLDDDFFVHAPSSGGVVRVDSLKNPYWQPRIRIIRRIQP